jgi:hypothetical protein
MDSFPEYASEADDTIFQMPDLTLKIGKRKLYVTKDDFKQISKVFEAMLTNDFKEKNSGEIEFKGKDYKTFVRFLRVSHPGLKDPFEGKEVNQSTYIIQPFKSTNLVKLRVLSEFQDWLVLFRFIYRFI